QEWGKNNQANHREHHIHHSLNSQLQLTLHRARLGMPELAAGIEAANPKINENTSAFAGMYKLKSVKLCSSIAAMLPRHPNAIARSKLTSDDAAFRATRTSSAPVDPKNNAAAGIPKSLANSR